MNVHTTHESGRPMDVIERGRQDYSCLPPYMNGERISACGIIGSHHGAGRTA